MRLARWLCAEFLRYLLVQILGALANLGVFVAALKAEPELIAHPVIPLAIGAGAGLLVNCAGATGLDFCAAGGALANAGWSANRQRAP